MNIGQKILTGIFMVLFLLLSVICMSEQRDAFQKTFVSWVCLGVVYTGLFFVFKTRPKAGQTAPIVPLSGHSESKRSVTSKKSKAIGICLLALALGVVAYSVNVAKRYNSFTNQLSAVQGVQIGDSRDSVKYRLGSPQNVLGPPESGPGEREGPRRVYTVSGADNDLQKMPSTTKVEDYDGWVYEAPGSNVRLTVGFNRSGFVESLELYSNEKQSPFDGWEAIAGLNFGDSEDKVLRLGQPSRQNLNGATKTIEYRDIGIVVTLAKGRAYMITIKGPQDKAAVFRRFMRTLP